MGMTHPSHGTGPGVTSRRHHAAPGSDPCRDGHSAGDPGRGISGSPRHVLPRSCDGVGCDAFREFQRDAAADEHTATLPCPNSGGPWRTRPAGFEPDPDDVSQRLAFALEQPDDPSSPLARTHSPTVETG